MTPFSLCKLPDIPLRKVLLNTSHLEQILLACSSHLLERKIKTYSLKVYGYQVHVEDGEPFIELLDKNDETITNLVLKNGKDLLHFSRNIDISGSFLRPLVTTVDNNLHFDLCNKVDFLDFLAWFKSVIQYEVGHTWALNLDIVGELGMQYLLFKPIFQATNGISIEGGCIEDWLWWEFNFGFKDLRSIWIKSEIDKDIKHCMPIKCRDSSYSSSNWMDCRGLYNLRDKGIIELGDSSFDHIHLNLFIHKWLRSDVDPVETLRYNIRKEAVVRTEELLDGLVTLKIISDFPLYMVTPKRENHKRRSVATFTIENNTAFFCTEEEDKYIREVEILKNLHLIDDWKRELKSIGLQKERCATLGTEKLMELNMSHIGITRKIIEATEKLKAEKDVMFDEGRASIYKV